MIGPFLGSTNSNPRQRSGDRTKRAPISVQQRFQWTQQSARVSGSTSLAEYEQSVSVLGNSKLASLLALFAAGALVVGYFQWREKERLAAENSQLRSVLQTAAGPPPPAQKIEHETNAAAVAEKLELLRLRNEVRQLRKSAMELEKLRSQQAALKLEDARLKTAGQAPSTNAPGLIARQDWRFAGYTSPEATLQTLSYSMAAGDFDGFVAGIAPAEREPFMKETEREKFATDATKGVEKMAGYRILGRDPLSNDEQIVLAVELFEANGTSKQQPLTFIRDGQEWRMTQREGKQQNPTPSQ